MKYLTFLIFVSIAGAQEVPFTYWGKGPIVGSHGGINQQTEPGNTQAYLITQAGVWNGSIDATKDTRTPTTRPANHCRIQLKADFKGMFDLRGIHDAIIETAPSNLPTVCSISNNPCFITNDSTSQIIIQNVRLNGNVGVIRGTNITFNAVQFGDLVEGCNLQCKDFFAINCKQVGNVLGRNFMCDAVDGLVITSCIMTNSFIESPLRATTAGITHGLIYKCDISQDLSTRTGAKAAVTLRQLNDVLVDSNHIHNADLSFDSGQNGGKQTDVNLVVSNNVVDQPTLVGKQSESRIMIGANVSFATFVNNTIYRDAGEGITVSGFGIHDILIKDNDIYSSNSGIKCYDPAPYIQISGNHIHGKGVIIKGSIAHVTDLGGNNHAN